MDERKDGSARPSPLNFFPRQVVDASGNRWDWALLPIVFALLVLLAYGARQMATPYELGHEIPLSRDLSYLPYYLLRTTMRMFMALAASLVFSVVFAVLATRYRAMEKVLIPFLDILQSIPILGFLSITVTGFIALFPGSLLGVECAAIFAIFTSQAWNMAFSLYQSLKTVPAELQEAARVFQLSGWQRFWRLDLPYAMPALLWNMMMSMSGGWFFVVASEAISVSNQSIKLPGIVSEDTCCLASAGRTPNGQVASHPHMLLAGGLDLYMLDVRCRDTEHEVLTVPAHGRHWGIRSLSLRDHLLTVGAADGSLSFMDMRARRYMPVRDALPGGNQTAMMRETLRVGPGRRRGGVAQSNDEMALSQAVFCHAWDPTHRRLATAGGPILTGTAGCYAAVWS